MHLSPSGLLDQMTRVGCGSFFGGIGYWPHQPVDAGPTEAPGTLEAEVLLGAPQL